MWSCELTTNNIAGAICFISNFCKYFEIFYSKVCYIHLAEIPREYSQCLYRECEIRNHIVCLKFSTFTLGIIFVSSGIEVVLFGVTSFLEFLRIDIKVTFSIQSGKTIHYNLKYRLHTLIQNYYNTINQWFNDYFKGWFAWQ